MKLYESKRQVFAVRIERIATERRPGGLTMLNNTIMVNFEYMKKYNPQVGGYYLRDVETGFQSYEDAVTFNERWQEV